MKCSMLVLTVILLLPRWAWSLDPQQAIQRLVEKANSIQEQIVLKQDQLKVIKDDGDQSTIEQLQSEIVRLKMDRKVALGTAIDTCLVGAGIVRTGQDGSPIMPTGTNVHPSSKGQDITWQIIYSDDLVCKDAIGCSKTSADGVTTLSGDFSDWKSLAVSVLMGKIRFQQFTTPGSADKLSHYDRDIKAWEDVDTFLNGLQMSTADQINWSRKINQRASQAKKAKDSRPLLVKAKERFSPDYSYGVGEAPHTADELAAIQDEASGLRERIQGSKALAGALVRLAGKACPFYNIRQEDLDAFDWSANQQIGDPDEHLRGAQFMAPADLKCYRGVFQLLSDCKSRGETPDLDAIRQRAIDSGIVVPQAPVPVQVQPETPRPIVTPLLDFELLWLAQDACRNPDGMTAEHMRSRLESFPNGQRYPLSDLPAGCVKDLLSRLLELNATVPPGSTLRLDWLVGQAKQLNQRYAPTTPQGSSEPGPKDKPVDPGNHGPHDIPSWKPPTVNW